MSARLKWLLAGLGVLLTLRVLDTDPGPQVVEPTSAHRPMGPAASTVLAPDVQSGRQHAISAAPAASDAIRTGGDARIAKPTLAEPSGDPFAPANTLIHATPPSAAVTPSRVAPARTSEPLGAAPVAPPAAPATPSLPMVAIGSWSDADRTVVFFSGQGKTVQAAVGEQVATGFVVTRIDGQSVEVRHTPSGQVSIHRFGLDYRGPQASTPAPASIQSAATGTR